MVLLLISYLKFFNFRSKLNDDALIFFVKSIFLDSKYTLLNQFEFLII